jgi:hypothetical protein
MLMARMISQIHQPLVKWEGTAPLAVLFIVPPAAICGPQPDAYRNAKK